MVHLPVLIYLWLKLCSDLAGWGLLLISELCRNLDILYASLYTEFFLHYEFTHQMNFNIINATQSEQTCTDHTDGRVSLRSSWSLCGHWRRWPAISAGTASSHPDPSTSKSSSPADRQRLVPPVCSRDWPTLWTAPPGRSAETNQDGGFRWAKSNGRDLPS